MFVGGVLGLQARWRASRRLPHSPSRRSRLLNFRAVQRPLRRRVQNGRFDRARIDAEWTAQGFRARLRDEVAIDAISPPILQADPNGMARSSTQGLWLRAARDRSAVSGLMTTLVARASALPGRHAVGLPSCGP